MTTTTTDDDAIDASQPNGFDPIPSAGSIAVHAVGFPAFDDGRATARAAVYRLVSDQMARVIDSGGEVA